MDGAKRILQGTFPVDLGNLNRAPNVPLAITFGNLANSRQFGDGGQQNTRLDISMAINIPSAQTGNNNFWSLCGSSIYAPGERDNLVVNYACSLDCYGDVYMAQPMFYVFEVDQADRSVTFDLHTATPYVLGATARLINVHFPQLDRQDARSDITGVGCSGSMVYNPRVQESTMKFRKLGFSFMCRGKAVSNRGIIGQARVAMEFYRKDVEFNDPRK